MQWFLHIDGQQHGPLTPDQARVMASQYPNAVCWRQGMAQWLPVFEVAELQSSPAWRSPPPMNFGAMGRARADEIDYIIYGEDMQFVEVELDAGESAIAEAGAMMYKDASITMNAVFGDASGNEGGLVGKLLGAGKRLLTGENLFTTVFTHEGHGKARVAFAAPFPGTIVPVSLAQVAGGTLICQKDSFLAAARGVSIGIHFQRRILTGLFGGEGFIMQRLEGDGMVFIHAGGTLKEITLHAGQTLHVDTGCLVALEPSVDFDIEAAGGIKSMLFGGEGVFFARVRGPGRVWLQSLPFSRLAGRMLQSATGGVGSAQEEGSVLGEFGRIFEK